MSRTPRVQKAAEAEVVPTTDSSLNDDKPLMDLSDRRAGRGDSLRAGLGQEATSEVGQVAGFRRDA
jgi:hypothetical protein